MAFVETAIVSEGIKTNEFDLSPWEQAHALHLIGVTPSDLHSQTSDSCYCSKSSTGSETERRKSIVGPLRFSSGTLGVLAFVVHYCAAHRLSSYVLC